MTDWISPELAIQEPEQVAEYNKLRAELGELTSRVFGELATASLADYSPSNPIFVDTFVVPVSASPATNQSTSNKVLPVEKPNLPGPVASQCAQKPAAPPDNEDSLQPEPEQPETTKLSATNIESDETETAATIEEETEAVSSPPAFLQALANIYGETAVYGSGKGNSTTPTAL